MRKNKPNIILENIEIIDIAAEGKAVARVTLAPMPGIKDLTPPHSKGEGDAATLTAEKPELESKIEETDSLTPYPSPAGEGSSVSPDKKPDQANHVAEEGKKLIVFVKGAIPGDVVDLEIFRKKKNYAEAKVLKIHKFSEKRDEPFCHHFGTCGGCKWQNLKYEEQLFYKQKQVVDAMIHIGKLNPSPMEGGEILPIIPSKNQTYYRNKLEFAFSNKRWLSNDEIIALPFGKGWDGLGALGFHISGMFDKVLDIEQCYLQPAPSNEIRLAIKDYALKNNLTFFDFRKQVGFMRNIIIRNSSIGELMVVVVFCNPSPALPEEEGESPSPALPQGKGDSPSPALPEGKGDAYTHAEEKTKSAEEIILELLNFISEKFPEITSLMYINNPKKNDTIYDLDVHLFRGRNFIYETLEDLRFKISAKSFFQTNSHQALELYKVARDFAQIKKTDVVYDLYTGTGTIANFIARSAKKIIGIDSVPDAIVDALENSRLNNISNTAFFAGDMRDVLNGEFVMSNGKPDVIITDPPRAGMDEKVVNKILEIAPQRIVYVSCNPATQARDLAILNSSYELKKIQPVDMFPHTHHVENVAVMERRG